MSELQGSRILGEERSGRRRSLWWITAGVIALLPLALLIPFACQTLRRGSDSQGRGSGAQKPPGAQDADRGQGGGREGAGEGQQPVYAMVHADDPAGGRYTFPDGDPPDLAGGELAVEPFRYAVSGEEAGGRPPANEPKLRGPKPCRKAV